MGEDHTHSLGAPLNSTAINDACGTSSRNNPSFFGSRPLMNMCTPERLPPVTMMLRPTATKPQRA